MPNFGAVANVDRHARRRFAADVDRDPDGTDRFLHSAAIRARDARDPDTDRGAGHAAHAARHLHGDLFADGAKLFEILGRHTELLLFHRIRVRDHATEYDATRTGNLSQPRAKQSASAALGDGNRVMMFTAQVEHDFGHRHAVGRIRMNADHVADPCHGGVEATRCFVCRQSARGDAQIHPIVPGQVRQRQSLDVALHRTEFLRQRTLGNARRAHGARSQHRAAAA